MEAPIFQSTLFPQLAVVLRYRLLHLYPLITRKQQWRYPFDEFVPAEELTIFHVFRLTFDFFPRKFAACSKPPSRDNHRKGLYQRTQQRDQGAEWTQIMRSWSSLKRRLYLLG